MSFVARVVAWILLVRGLAASRRGSGGGSRTVSTGRTTGGGGRSSVASTEARHAEGQIPAQRSGDPGPDSPLELESTDWKATLKRTMKEIKDDRVTLAAAGMAYYFFLALIPALIAFIGIMGLLDIDTTDITQRIQKNLPGSSGRVLSQPLESAQDSSDNASLVAAIGGIAVALWSASSGFGGLQGALNIAYDVPEERKFVRKRLVALALLVATGLLGGVPSPFLTFGDTLVFQILGWVLTLVAVSILFSIYYYIAPNRESPTWQWVSFGGVIGMILWIVVSVGFNIYVEQLGSESYSRTYGSLAGVIILILYLFLSSLAVLIGGELNSEIERQGERRTQAA
jgi:membrane protein